MARSNWSVEDASPVSSAMNPGTAEMEDTAAGTGARGSVPVESARRVLKVLRCFSRDNPELGATDIAGMLGMHKSTVHRLLITLEKEGFVRHTAGGRYSLNWLLLEIAAAIPVQDGIQQAVRAQLSALVEMTGETAHLAVLDAGAVLYVQKVTGTRQLRMPSAVGTRVPLHCTSLGKVLLAGLSDVEFERMLSRKPLQRMTANTIVSPEELREHIASVRLAGYATDVEEIEEGLTCIAAPIVDPVGKTSAAISISGPASRFQLNWEENISAVKQVASTLSAELGPLVSQLTDISTD